MNIRSDLMTPAWLIDEKLRREEAEHKKREDKRARVYSPCPCGCGRNV